MVVFSLQWEYRPSLQGPLGYLTMDSDAPPSRFGGCVSL